MDYVWELIQPYVVGVLSFLVGSGIAAVIFRAVVNKLLNRNSATLNKTYNVEQVSQKVAEKLAGKTLNIDVTAVTEKALKKTTQQLDARIEKAEEVANSHTAILIGIAKGIIKLKALTDEEKAEIASAVRQLEKGYTPPAADEVMTVRLAPVEIEQDEDDIRSYGDPPGDPGIVSGLNFGGLDTK